MAGRKDSRLRTVQREYGKVFVVMFGIKYQPPKDSRLKVGDDVLVTEGSNPQVIGLKRPKDGHFEVGWSAYGIEGGEKAKAKALADWQKFMDGEKSIGMAKADAPKDVRHVAAKEPPKERKSGELPDISDVRGLAKDYDFTQIVKRVAVRFRDRSSATTFRMAAHRRGWKVTEPLTDDGTGESEVLVQAK